MTTGDSLLAFSQFNLFHFLFSKPDQMNGALIIGLESRVSQIEDKLEDLDARTSEEADNALNEREMDRFKMSGDILDLYLGLLNFVCYCQLNFILIVPLYS